MTLEDRAREIADASGNFALSEQIVYELALKHLKEVESGRPICINAITKRCILLRGHEGPCKFD